MIFSCPAKPSCTLQISYTISIASGGDPYEIALLINNKLSNISFSGEDGTSGTIDVTVNIGDLIGFEYTLNGYEDTYTSIGQHNGCEVLSPNVEPPVLKILGYNSFAAVEFTIYN